VLCFESIGDNCELGMVQRRVGEEPLGLLRFASAPLLHLLTALRARFAGMADPERIRISVSHGEYMVDLTAYGMNYHPHVRVGEADPAALLQQQIKVVRFLTDKLIADLEQPQKILVFRQNEPLLAADLLRLRMALSSYGPGVLLWVQEAGPDDVPGSVVAVDERLMVGYVERLAPRHHVPDLDVPCWLRMLRSAYRQYMMQLGAWQPPTETLVVFGRDGNAGGVMDYGWSIPEQGYTWAIGERSLLLLDNPGSADRFWLAFDGSPYECQPLLPRQRLDVLIDSVLVHSFDPVPRGLFGCEIPGHLIAGRQTIALQLDHPFAASPMLVAGQNDSRRLGIAFRSLRLSRRVGV
jgi:hypothetical protein